MTRTISTADIAALQAVRSVIADATGHPGQQAAIEAIDRLGKADPMPTGTLLDATQPHPEVRALVAPASLLDFIELAWPTLHPGKPFERTPVIEHICRAVERYGAETDGGAAGNPVSWYADGTGPIRQEFTWKADPWSDGILTSERSRLVVGINRDCNNVIAFPLNPSAGKRREVTRLDVRVTYVDRDAPAPGMLIVDDPHSAKQVDPSPEAVKAWCAAAGVTVPERPAVQRSEDLLAGIGPSRVAE